MTRLNWSENKDHAFGLDRGVFYPPNGIGEAWNGLVEVEENEADDNQVQYVDGVKIHKRRRSGEFSGTIKAYTYPDSFSERILESRRTVQFGLSYRIMTDSAYQIHLVYNALIGPFQKVRANDTTEPFSLEFTTKPPTVPDASNTSHLVVDSGVSNQDAILELESILYGTDSVSASLPAPNAVYDIFEKNAELRVFDNGDGTFTVDGPDSAIRMIDATTFEIDWVSAVYVDDNTYTIKSF